MEIGGVLEIIGVLFGSNFSGFFCNSKDISSAKNVLTKNIAVETRIYNLQMEID